MNQYNDEYGEWLTEETQDSNILATLSRNLQKYENIMKSNDHQQFKLNLLSDRRILKNDLRTINHPMHSDKQNHKLNDIKQTKQKILNMKWAERVQVKNVDAISAVDRRQSRERQFKIRATSRNSRSRHEQRDDLVPLKLKQLRFEKKDKKKFKDRCVDLYIQNKNKISLRQIDSINKQSKQQKIDLFLKLLRR